MCTFINTEIIGTLVALGLAGLLAGLFLAVVILAIRALWLFLHPGNANPQEESVRRSLGEAIKAHRTRCGMTQELLAERLGVSRQAVSKWEMGQSDPSTANLLSLAQLFGVSVEELLGGAQ